MKGSLFQPSTIPGPPELGTGEGFSVGLTPRKVLWPAGALAASFASIVFAVALMLKGAPLWSLVVVLFLGLIGAVTVSFFGWRKQKRDELADRIIESLAIVIADTKKPSRRDFQFKKWERGYVGSPSRIFIRFEARMNDESPEWRAGVAEKVSQRTGEDYEVVSVDPRQCIVELGFAEPVEETPPDPVFKTKAVSLSKQFFGDSAKIDVALTDGETDEEKLPTAVEVAFETDRKWAKRTVRSEVEMTVNAYLPGRWRPNWNLTDDVVKFELRPTMPHAVKHPVPAFGDITDTVIPYAIDEDGRVCVWDLKAAGPHMIVVGRTGTGKTVLILGILIEAAARGWRIWVSDPKRVEFLGLRGWPNVQIVATQVPEQIAMIHKAYELMEYRYSLIEAGEADEDDFEPLIVCLDEYRDFVAMVTGWYQAVKERGMPSKCPVFEEIGSLARKGRTARIHLLMGTQRPDADFLGGEMRDNFPARTALGSLSPQGSQMMWNAPNVGISLPKGVKGRATGVTPDGVPGEIQVYWTPDPRRAYKSGNQDDIDLLDTLVPPVRSHPPLKVDIAEEEFGDEGYSEWTEVLAAELVEITPEEARKPRAMPTTTVTTTEIDPSTSHDSQGTDDGYMPAEEMRATEVEAGDLLELEGHWVVVEGSVADPGDEDVWCLDYRTDEDESEMLAVDAADVLNVRKPDNSEPEATGLLDEESS